MTSKVRVVMARLYSFGLCTWLKLLFSLSAVYCCIYKGLSCLFSVLAFFWLKSQIYWVWCLKMASPVILWSAPALCSHGLFLHCEHAQGKRCTATLWQLLRADHAQWSLLFAWVSLKSLFCTILCLPFPLLFLVWLWKLCGKSQVRALGHRATCTHGSSSTLIFSWQNSWWLQKLGCLVPCTWAWTL